MLKGGSRIHLWINHYCHVVFLQQFFCENGFRGYKAMKRYEKGKIYFSLTLDKFLMNGFNIYFQSIARNFSAGGGNMNTGRPRIQYPGRIELFYFFWALRPGYYVQQCIFFSTISGPFSHNLDRDIDPRSRFFEFFFVFLQLFSTGIICQNII